MVIALIPIGDSKRLKNKHFLNIGGKKIIEIIVDKISNISFFEDIVIYSTVPVKIKNTNLIIDQEKKGPLNVLLKVLKIYEKNVFLLAGDMPFISAEYIEKMLIYPEQLSVIPRWENGYLEPMHALYSKSCLNYNEKESFHEFIKYIPKIFLKAENFPRYQFFNINTV
ncbi:MAG: NTP transferase domain-containing protein, partial [Thermoplasmata archaeon]